MYINVFRFAEMPYFPIYNNKIRTCTKKFINGCRISIVSVTPKKAEMVPFWEKYCIFHLSYLLNESGDIRFFSFLRCVYHEIQPWEVLGNFHF